MPQDRAQAAPVRHRSAAQARAQGILQARTHADGVRGALNAFWAARTPLPATPWWGPRVSAAPQAPMSPAPLAALRLRGGWGSL